MVLDRDTAQASGGQPVVDAGNVIVDGASRNPKLRHDIRQGKPLSNGLGEASEQLNLATLEFHAAPPRLTIGTLLLPASILRRPPLWGITNLVQEGDRRMCKYMYFRTLQHRRISDTQTPTLALFVLTNACLAVFRLLFDAKTFSSQSQGPNNCTGIHAVCRLKPPACGRLHQACKSR